MSLVRRAQLAVTAHIRHVYTDYDQLLKSVKWVEARRLVEQHCLDVLVQWRGDDDDDGEIDDILQEVIVIPDDDDDDEDSSVQPKQRADRDYQYRRESSRATAVHVQNEPNVGHTPTAATVYEATSQSSESDDEDAVQYLGVQSSHHQQAPQYNQRRLEQMGAHRHKIWEEARDRRRNNTQFTPLAHRQHPLCIPVDQQGSHLRSLDRRSPMTERPSYQSLIRERGMSSTSRYTRLIPLFDQTSYTLNDSNMHSGYHTVREQVSLIRQ